MNTPSPLIPQGSLLDQKNRSRARVKVAFFAVVGVHVAVILTALLAQGCKRDPAPAPVAEPHQPVVPEISDTLPTFDPPSLAMDPAPSNDIPPYVPPPPRDPAPFVPAPLQKEHVVQRGDTFYSIGLKHGVSMKAIQDANPNVNPSRLQVGQRLVIPAASTAVAPGGSGAVAPAAEGQIYVVKAGDNLTKIAAKYGITVNALRRANNLATDRINVGDKLKIPAAASAPPQ